jgi:hypothetical protein
VIVPAAARRSPGQRFFFVLCLSVLSGLRCYATRIEDDVSFGGERFNGSLSIVRLNSSSTASSPPTVALIVNGQMSIDLPDEADGPQTGLYQVEYTGKGVKVWEKWSVPPSSTPLRRQNVAITGSETDSRSWARSTAITDITGLSNALGQRPSEGPGFGVSAVAVINANGQIETVVGDAGACVLTDGTAAPCSVAPVFVDAETPAGTIDGSNCTFTLANLPDGASLALFRNGLYLTAGIDYLLSAQNITFVPLAVPQPSDALIASYRIASGTRGVSTRSSAQSTAPGGRVLLCSVTGTVVESLGFGIPYDEARCSIPMRVLAPFDKLTFTFATSASSLAGFGVDLVMEGASIYHAMHVKEPNAGPQRVEIPVVDVARANVEIVHFRLTANSVGTELVKITLMQVTVAAK